MWENLALVLSTLTFVLLLIKFWLQRGQPDYWTKLGFPTIITEQVSLFDLLTGRKSNNDADLKRYAALGKEKYGGLMEFGVPLLLVKDLDLARDIFIKDFHHFFDRRDFANSDPIVSESLFFRRGQAWKDMRAFLSPTFTSGKIKRMFPHFEKSAKNLQKYVHSQSNSDLPLDDAIRKFTIEVIGSAAFGLDIDIFSDQDSLLLEMANRVGTFNLSRKIKFALLQSFPRLCVALGFSILDTEAGVYFGSLLKTAFRAREQNVTTNKKGDDFLQLLVQARRDGGQSEATGENELNEEEQEGQLRLKDGANKNNIVWSDDIAVSQAFIFIVGGFDTIANNLMVAIYMLASHLNLQDKVWEEVDRITGGGNITYESLNEMKYLDNFISETLRLYPAVTRLERKCMVDYPIPSSKHVIPAGTIVTFPAEAIHRDESYWPNSENFDPERFSSENKSQRNSYAYMPFGIGPRNCIGMRFAIVKTKVALAHIVKNFRIAPPESGLTMGLIRDVIGYKAPPGLKIRFIPRN